MNKIVPLVLCLMTAGTAPAQLAKLEPETVGSSPQAPVVAPVPEGARWTIATKPLRAWSGDSPDASPGTTETHAFSAGIRKSTTKSGGYGTEFYLTSSDVLFRDPHSGVVHVQDTQDLLSGAPPSRPGHFDELLWIKPSSYAGDIEHLGKHCWIFREFAPEETSHGSESKPRSILRTALIDKQTRLPVAWEDSDGLRIYTFDDSLHPFALPPEFARALELRRQSQVDLKMKYTVPQ